MPDPKCVAQVQNEAKQAAHPYGMLAMMPIKKEYFDDGADYDIGQQGPDEEVDQSAILMLRFSTCCLIRPEWAETCTYVYGVGVE